MTIDQYIKKATAGLPSRERVDTAAELRVHLNVQVKKHLLEGHSREEAEFLAVDAMGAPAPVNRQFFGHIFTPRVGWWLVAMAVLAVSSWWAWLNRQLWLNPPAQYSSVHFKSPDLNLLPLTKLELRPGQGIQGVRWAVMYQGKILGGTVQTRDKPQRLEPVILSYSANSPFITKNCPKGGFLVNGVTYCTKDYDGCYGDVSHGYAFNSIVANRWVPTYNQVSRVGAQSKHGTTEACVLWIKFINPDLPIGEPDPPTKFYPYANYFDLPKP